MLNLNHWPYFQSTIISTLVNNKSSYPVGSFHPWPPHLPYRDSCIYLKGSSQVISNLLDANFRLAFLNLGWFIAPDKGIEPLHSIQRLMIRSNEESNSEVLPSGRCVHLGSGRLLWLISTPLWKPSHWRVELRCLLNRTRAQGDPTNRSGCIILCPRGDSNSHAITGTRLTLILDSNQSCWPNIINVQFFK